MKTNELLNCLIEQVGGEKQAHAMYIKSRLGGLKKTATLDEVVKLAEKEGLYGYLKKLSLSEVAELIAGGKLAKPGRRGRPAKAKKEPTEKTPARGKAKKTRTRTSPAQAVQYETAIATFLGKKSNVALSAVCQGIGVNNKPLVRRLLSKLVQEKKVKAVGEKASRKYSLMK